MIIGCDYFHELEPEKFTIFLSGYFGAGIEKVGLMGRNPALPEARSGRIPLSLNVPQ
jgi:hypothetical protein